MRLSTLLVRACLSLVCFFSTAAPSLATEWFVASGGTGVGTPSAPFGRIQDGLNSAQPGDVVSVAAGTYLEGLSTVRSGTAAQRIVVRSLSGPGSVIVTVSGRVLTVNHAYLTIDGLVFDGQYGADDTVRVAFSGTAFTLRNSEVRRSGRDTIDMGSVDDVLIESSLIHHALNSTGGRSDAHGIVAGAVHRLTIRNTDIHTFSGDGIQVDAGRSAPGWSDVLIEGCRIWLTPLATPENGFPAGTVTGENAIDTKASASYPRASIVIRNVETWGFRGGLIANMAPFNLKENIDALVDSVLVHDSEIAFRLRGPGSTGNGAWVRIQNAIVHDVAYAFRYEDNIENLRIWNDTLGTGVTKSFYAASSSWGGLDVQNLLVLGSSLPAEAFGFSNLAVPSSAFVNAAGQDYQLADSSLAVDTGILLPGVTRDFGGTSRPQGAAYDVGAYERVVGTAPPPPPPPPTTPPPTSGGGTSADGTTIPSATQIIDASGAVWTLSPSKAILRNGASAAGGSGTQILWKNSTIYVLGTDSRWYEWTRSDWISVGTSVPGGTTPPPTSGGGTSADGTTIPSATQIIDASGAVWTLSPSKAILRNGASAAGGSGTQILWKNGTIYVLGTDSRWYEWTRSDWIGVGTSVPGGTTPPPTSGGGTSADGTTIPSATQIIDASGAVWTLSPSKAILRNGASAAGGSGTQILWKNGTIYVLGTDSRWYEWTGSGWLNVGTSVPGGTTPPPTSGGGTSADGTTIPSATQIIDASGAVWTLSPSKAILRNGASAAGGSGTQILWKNGKIYVLGTDSRWYEWTGADWLSVGATVP